MAGGEIVLAGSELGHRAPDQAEQVDLVARVAGDEVLHDDRSAAAAVLVRAVPVEGVEPDQVAACAQPDVISPESLEHGDPVVAVAPVHQRAGGAGDLQGVGARAAEQLHGVRAAEFGRHPDLVVAVLAAAAQAWR